MRRMRVLAPLVGLAVFTHLLVRGLMGVAASPSPRPAIPEPQAGETIAELDPGTPPTRVLTAAENSLVLMSGGVGAVIPVVLEDGLVYFASKGRVYDRASHRTYYWKARIFDGKGQDLLIEWPYLDQPIEVVPRVDQHASIVASLPIRLEPGDYVLELSMFDPAQQPDISMFKSNERLKVE